MKQTVGGLPLLSVIIPTMNSQLVIGNVLQSLAEQTWRKFEVIISDGNSSDGTLRIVAEYVERLPALIIDKRLDRGVYDAINKGVALARGEWFLVLGSDDTLHAPETLQQVSSHLERAGDSLMVYGDVRMMTADWTADPSGGRYAGPVPLERLMQTNICQQAIFYRISLFNRLGGFDLKYPLYADWAFNLRAAFITPSRWIDVVVSDYAATGMSSKATDTVFLAELSELIRSEFARRPSQRELWPNQRVLVRYAKGVLRNGQVLRAWKLSMTFLCLMLGRILWRAY